MGWETSDRKEHLPPDWERIRVERLKKDGWRCTWNLPSGRRCPRRATEVDHRGDRDNHSQSNLRSLCEDHHKQRTQVQAQAARKKKSRARPSEAHPGLVP